MAKMYGKFRPERQNSKGWTKAQMRHDEERQISKDIDDELDMEYVASRPIAGYPYDSTRVRDNFPVKYVSAEDDDA